MNNFKVLLFKYSESEHGGWGHLEKIKSIFRKNKKDKNDEFDHQDLDKRRIQNYGVKWENGDTILCMCNETQLINFICKVRVPSKENGLFDYTTPLFLQKPINFEYEINSEPLYKLLNPGKSKNPRTTLFNLSDFGNILNLIKSKIIEDNPSQRKEIEEYFSEDGIIYDKNKFLGRVKMTEELTQEQIDKKFNEYKNKGQIEFITFHPSYSYEEFVEGLTVTSDDEGRPNYFKKDGIFKKLCIKSFWSIVKKKETLQIISSFNDSYQKFLDAIGEGKVEYATLRGNKFRLEVNDNENLIVTPSGSERNKGYLVSKNRLAKLFENIESIKIPSDVRTVIGGCQQSYYYTVCEEIKKIGGNNKRELNFDSEEDYKIIKSLVINFITKNLTKKDFEGAEKYVLIIDEINRGDISKIFGELITLIEEDKRIGGENPLTVKLPCSGEIFAVPLNLHIIGTMNTADRSLVQIDTALRRRFIFEAMWPDFDLPQIKDYINEIKFLERLNASICNESALGQEKLIGHAYLFERRKYEQTDWLQKIILPLVYEYSGGSREIFNKLLNNIVKCNNPEKWYMFEGNYEVLTS